MEFTYVENITSSIGERRSEPSFVEFGDWLLSMAQVQADKKKAPAWSPALFSTGRLQKDVEGVTALVFDFDQPVDLSFLRRLNLAHIVHSTYTAPGSRAIIALSRPVTPQEWEVFWLKCVESFNIQSYADPACKNVGRVYFVPTCPEGSEVKFQLYYGDPIPVDELLTSNPEDLALLRKVLLKVSRPEQAEAIRLALAGKPVAQEGNRDNTVSGLGFYLGKFVVPSTYSVEGVTELLRRGFALPGPESHEHWVKVFQKGFAQGRAEKSERVEESKSSQGLTKDWAAQLQTQISLTGEVKVLSNTHNAFVILSNEGTYSFRENVLAGAIEYRSGEREYTTFDDVACTHVGNWLVKSYKVTLTKDQVWSQVAAIARQNSYDPIRSYLVGLRGDYETRLDLFLTKYLGCEDTPLTRIYSRRWLIALVARALRPGCKMDDVLTLVGEQGIGKSTAFRLLTEPWFSDSKIIIGDKDSYALAAAGWVHECAELASLKKADLETMKNFFSSPEDTYRPVWERVPVKRPRRCVFVATTNQTEFLKDETGNRRWWVVRCVRAVDLAALERDREVILAEAVKAFSSGESWHLNLKERELQEADLEQHMEDNGLSAYVEAVRDWWNSIPFSQRPPFITTADVVRKAWNIELNQSNARSMSITAGKVLTQMGCSKIQPQTLGKRERAWRPPLSWHKLEAVK